MNSAQSFPRRSIGQWIVTVIFGLLSLAFFFRFVEFALKWVRHVVEADVNFKVLTLWSLIYAIVTAGIAAAAYFMTAGDETASLEKENL